MPDLGMKGPSCRGRQLSMNEEEVIEWSGDQVVKWKEEDSKNQGIKWEPKRDKGVEGRVKTRRNQKSETRYQKSELSTKGTSTCGVSGDRGLSRAMELEQGEEFVHSHARATNEPAQRTD